MTRWFRLYDDVLDDPKVQRLPAALFKVWVNLLCVASKHDGVLPSVDDIAFALRADARAVAGWIGDLQGRGLIDDLDGEKAPHNWRSRQFKSDADPTAAERQARKRARDAADKYSAVTQPATPMSRVTGCDVTRDITPSRYRDRAEQSSLRSQNDARKLAFDRFWAAWPNRVGKAAAERALAKVSDHIEIILEGVATYIRDKPPDRAWLNPATFINGSRWLDEPAAVTPGNTRAGPAPQPRSRNAHLELLKELDHADRHRDATPQFDLELSAEPEGA